MPSKRSRVKSRVEVGRRAVVATCSWRAPQWRVCDGSVLVAIEQLVRGQRSGTPRSFGACESRSKSSRASAKRPPSKRASPTSARMRCISSSTTRREALGLSSGVPSTSGACGGATARPGRARSPRSPRPPSGCRAARSRCRAATPRGTGRRRARCGAGPPRCACPRARAADPSRVDLHVVALARRAGSGPACARRRSRLRDRARGPGARPRCRRGRPSPRAACRRAPSRARPRWPRGRP